MHGRPCDAPLQSSEQLKGELPSAAVVVCTRDRPRQLESCLQALSRLRCPLRQVLVVDNAPRQYSAQPVAARWGADYVLEPVAGLSRARNRGARTANAEIVAYVDDDAIPQPGWLAALAAEFGDPRVMAVSGPILAAGEASETDWMHKLDLGRWRRVLDRQTADWFEMSNFGGIGHGGNMAFRRSAFELWPGFDERLGRGAKLDGGEESYAFFCLIERGYRVVYTPRAIVRHPAPPLEQADECWLAERARSVAYFCFLFAEQPPSRGHVIRYLVSALRGRRRHWRPSPPSPPPVAQWRIWRALASGPLLYARARAQRRHRRTGPGDAR